MKYLSFKWLAKLLVFVALAGCTAQLLGCRRANLAVVLVRDTSGSVKKYDRQMDKIFANTISQLKRGDVVIPIHYSTYASVLRDSKRRELILEIRGQKDKDRLIAAFSNLQSDGEWTYFRRAIHLAIERLVRYRKEYPSQTTPLILVVTDGISDTPESEPDLDPQTLGRLFHRPEAKNFKLHVVQVGGLVQGKTTATKALAHLLNVQVVTLAATPNLSKAAAAAISDILHKARATRSGRFVRPLEALANVPVKKIGIVALLTLLVLGGLWAAYLLQKQEDPFSMTSIEEPKLQACVIVRQEGKAALEYPFKLVDKDRMLFVGSSPEADVTIEEDEKILPKHLLMRLLATGEVLMKFSNKRKVRGWQRLDEGMPVELSPRTSILVTMQEEPAHAFVLFEAESS